MSEQNWLGNDVWDAAVVRDPLFDPNFGPWGVIRPCQCPPECRHSDSCSWTPIFAALSETLPLPNPWTDWPMASVYIGMFPNHEPYYVQRFIFGDLPAMIMPSNPIFDPKYSVNEGNWLLPTHPAKTDPPSRQENPDQ